MICPDCDNGMLLVKSPMVRRYFKSISCPSCDGSGMAHFSEGEDASHLDPNIGDKFSTGTFEPLVV